LTEGRLLKDEGRLLKDEGRLLKDHARDGLTAQWIPAMSETSKQNEAVDSETAITLGLLSAVERGEPLTQRTLASELGIALGLANSYLKRCVRKGLIKVNQVPPNRYAYYLTPQGFSEKARLTGEYLSGSFNFFRRARAQCTSCLSDAAARGYKRVALAGVSELAEIAILCKFESGVEIVGIVDANVRPGSFAGLKVVPDPAGLPKHDALLVTDISRAQSVYDRLISRYGQERVLAPEMLHVRVRPSTPLKRPAHSDGGGR
jgi:DNA-binding MarR family transcriptional regulator